MNKDGMEHYAVIWCARATGSPRSVKSSIQPDGSDGIVNHHKFGRGNTSPTCALTAAVVAMAILSGAGMTSCTVAHRGEGQLDTVDVYREEDLRLPHRASLAPGGPVAASPEPDVDGGASRFVPARLRAARESLRALATHRGATQQIDVLAMITREFQRYDAAYLAQQASRGKRLDALKLRLVGSENSGKALPCSRQLMIEAEWMLDYTADWRKLDQKLSALERSLATKDQGFALRQQPDGSWGGCYDAWFERINGTVNAAGLLPVSADGSPPKLQYSLGILNRIDSSATLIPYLYRLQLSQIGKTGVYEREELGGVEGALSQFLFKPELLAALRANGAAFMDQAYVDAYRRFLDDTQDPISGYWGPWLMSDGEILRAADLSQTYHTVSYRKGAVNHWPEIIETTLSIKDLPYPFGWRHNGQYNNHNDYDVVKILHLGWSHMTPMEMVRARAEIRAMLKWALAEAVTSDGQFRDDLSFYDSIGEAYYYGVSFLEEVGYWSSDQPFWAEETIDFPDAKQLCRQIAGRLWELQENSTAAQEAMTRLHKSCHGTESR